MIQMQTNLDRMSAKLDVMDEKLDRLRELFRWMHEDQQQIHISLAEFKAMLPARAPPASTTSP